LNRVTITCIALPGEDFCLEIRGAVAIFSRSQDRFRTGKIGEGQDIG